jgi:putative oxidoreductase
MAAFDFLEPYARSILRIVVGFTFSFHGMQKILGLFGGMGGSGARAHLFTIPWIAGCLELFGGLLILLGLFTRPVVFVLCGEMAVAYFTMHFPHGFFPIRNGGELAVVYCFVYLYLFFAGPGPLSADVIIRKKPS